MVDYGLQLRSQCNAIGCRGCWHCESPRVYVVTSDATLSQERVCSSVCVVGELCKATTFLCSNACHLITLNSPRMGKDVCQTLSQVVPNPSNMVEKCVMKGRKRRKKPARRVQTQTRNPEIPGPANMKLPVCSLLRQRSPVQPPRKAALQFQRLLSATPSLMVK